VSVSERFWAKAIVGYPDECWLWTGHIIGPHSPYGQFWHEGRNRPAAKVAWELANDESFPEGKHACHHCDNPRCVNPAHIFPGTNQENMLDASRKGRLPKQRKRRTHCKRGHAYDEANTYYAKDGSQQCRTCKRRRDREYAKR